MYALGVLLFELLADARPYRVARESASGLEHAILAGDVYRPSERATDPATRRALEGDLDTIVLKALRRSADERYPSVLALRDDLRRWREGRPVLARPATLGYRASRFVRRHALGVAAASAVVLAIVGGAGVSLWQASVARAEQQRAEQVTDLIESIFADADPYTGDGTPVNATDLLVQARARMDESLVEQDDTRLELLLVIAGSLANLEAYQEAEPIALEARALASRMHGEDDARTVRADVVMTEVHRFLGRLDAMDSTVERTYAALQRMRSPDSALLVSTLGNRAHVAIDRGRPNDAVAPAREALQVAEAFYPAGHDEIITAAQVFAVSLQNGDATPAEALEAAERSYALTRAHYANTPSHPRLVEGMLLYGRALGNAGNPREAIRVHEAAAEASATARGEANFMRAFIFGNAGKYRADLGQYASALADYDSALTILTSVGDTIGASYAITQGNRGEMLQRLGQSEVALRPLRESSALLQGLWGADHPRVVLTGLRIAVAEAEAGRLGLARQRVNQLVAAGVPDTYASELAFTRGVLARRGQSPAEAVQLFTQAIEALPDSTTPVGARDRARYLVELGRAQLARGERVLASEAFTRAVASFRAAQMDTTADERVALAGVGLGR